MVRSTPSLVCCVKTGDKYPAHYVYRLRAMLDRTMPQPYDFVCITDKPEDLVSVTCVPATLPGWWAKLQCFAMKVPLIFYDLDVVLTNNQAPLLDWEGFGIINDWGNLSHTTPQKATHYTKLFNSSVMKLTGKEGHVWEEFKPVVMERFRRGGDQRWITRCLPDAATFPPEWFVSYKADHCEENFPSEALAVIFHGHPKPHEITTGWVPKHWGTERA